MHKMQFVFPLQHSLRERDTVLLYTYIACLTFLSQTLKLVFREGGSGEV